MMPKKFTHLTIWGQKWGKGQNTIFAHVTETIHHKLAFKSYFNPIRCGGTRSVSNRFDQSCKLGVNMGMGIILCLGVMVTINH
jgi:hypothetical protein